MSDITFENYGIRARLAVSPTELAGRFEAQEAAERRIVPDVATKLDLGPEDRLLEIGCGPGALLIPLSRRARSATGIDHAAVVQALNVGIGDAAVETIVGNFLSIEVEGSFDCIIIYSVLHCLSDRSEVTRFIDKAAELLAPSGRMLLGDLPNADLKSRFLASPEGQAFSRQWDRDSAGDAARYRVDIEPHLVPDARLATFDDRFILDILMRYRSRGYETYILPQPPDLPFGNTREDILIVARHGTEGR